MINLICVGSGSSGNCYLLRHKYGTLILDCGVPFKEIQTALDYDFSEVVGVLITHKHRDHARSVKDLRLLGMPFYSPDLRQYGGFTITAVPLKDKKTGRWLHTNGDGSECPVYGFLIEVERHRIAYFTDFEYLPYTFREKPVTDFLIGCNHEDDAEVGDMKAYHVYSGHSSLSTVKEIIRVNSTPDLRNVILCHLTWAADRERMKSEISDVVGKTVNVHVAERGTSFLI